ncbi:hypothetical protein CERSUDRAFT_78034 [Gelatoporia subvermispora B]|uniref:Uncharacterized protein n=1 Tax=Ceriporiopsis subvermispora (strain B) TaxID=914234 RepID=M2R004_CERS8|nr:hypothetical protein CERSUDRAFT_78034 [Gelatoporia subvermispora B]
MSSLRIIGTFAYGQHTPLTQRTCDMPLGPSSSTGQPANTTTDTPAATVASDERSSETSTPSSIEIDTSDFVSVSADSDAAIDEGGDTTIAVQALETARTENSESSDNEQETLLQDSASLETPEISGRTSTGASHSGSALPPPQVFEGILHNLRITLRQQTQYRATFAPSDGDVVEPTVALYCPIEGGTVYIDEAVQELSRLVDADLVTVDAAQLVAEECEQFVEGGFLSFATLANKFDYHQIEPELDADIIQRDGDEQFPESGEPESEQKDLDTVNADESNPVANTLTDVHRLNSFFTAIINAVVSKRSASMGSQGRPMIVYVRDFQTVAPSSPAWYPDLLSAVQRHRRDPVKKTKTPTLRPTTIVLKNLQ